MKTLTVTVIGASDPVSMQVRYHDDKTEEENILRALNLTSIMVEREKFRDEKNLNKSSTNKPDRRKE